jgi:hypothetical protein
VRRARLDGDGEYSGGNGVQFDRINVFYHEASCGKYVPRAVPFDLEPGVIGALRTSPLGEHFCPGSLMNQNAGVGSNWAKAHYTKAGHEFCQNAGARNNWAKDHYTKAGTNSAESFCSVAAFVVNSKTHTRGI